MEEYKKATASAVDLGDSMNNAITVINPDENSSIDSTYRILYYRVKVRDSNISVGELAVLTVQLCERISMFSSSLRYSLVNWQGVVILFKSFCEI